MYTPSAADLYARAQLRAALTLHYCRAMQRALTAINL